MTITKNNLTFLTLVGLSSVGLLIVTTTFVKSLTSSSNYLGRLCSHMYDVWQKMLLTWQNSPANLWLLALGLILFLGLIRALFVLGRQIRETKQFIKEIPAVNFKPPLPAFCYGLIRQSIYLNLPLLKKLSPAEVQAVVLHEEYHLKNRDNLKVLIVRLLAGVWFFLPFIKNLAEDYESEKEFAADSYAAQKLGAPTVAAALYRLLEMSPLENTQNLLLGNFAPTAKRIERLLGEKTSPSNISWRSCFLNLTIILLIGLTFFQKPAAGAQNQMLMPTEKPNAACNSYCQPAVTCSKSDTIYIHPRAY